MEAEAVETVLRAIEAGAADLVSSDVLIAESSTASDKTRRDFAAGILDLAVATVPLTDDLQQAARPYRDAGMKAFDALHLASAVEIEADFLCTTDDAFYRRAREANTGTVRVVTPSEVAVALNL